jgi:hypothetical protein
MRCVLLGTQAYSGCEKYVGKVFKCEPWRDSGSFDVFLPNDVCKKSLNFSGWSVRIISDFKVRLKA